MALYPSRKPILERAGETLSADGGLGLGSARVSRVWFRRRAETNFICSFPLMRHGMSKEKFASAGRNRQAREMRALPSACLTRAFQCSPYRFA